MSTWIERHTPLWGDIYTMRRRPGHHQIILNDAYAGLRIVDPWDGTDVGKVPFSERFRQEGGAVGLLYVRADGMQALAADLEGQHGSLMDFRAGTSTDVGMPPAVVMRAHAHVWDEQGLICTDEKGEVFFLLSGEEFSRMSSLKVRMAHPGWRRMLHQYTSPCGRVVRIYNRARVMVTFHRAEARADLQVVHASWRDGQAWRTPAQDHTDDAAALPGVLCTVARNVVWQHVDGQSPMPLVRPEPPWEVRGVETLEGDGHRPPAVVTLLCHRAERLKHRLLWTPLERHSGSGDDVLTGT